MPVKSRTKKDLLAEMADLRQRMAEAEAILQAIRDYEVDALVVHAPQGDQVYALETADVAYRQMVEQMREGAASLTPDGLILYGNQRLATLLGCRLDQLVGEPFAQFMPAAERPRLAGLLSQAEGGRASARVETADGRHIPVSFSASRLQVDEQPVVLLLITDLTYERQADRVTRLLHLTTRLAMAVTYAQAAEAIVNGALRVFDADCGFVAVPIEGGTLLRTLHAVGYSAERLQQLEVLSPHDGQPVFDAIRLRDLVLVESAEERQQRYPHWPAPQAEGGAGALLAVPLLLPDRLVGVLQIGLAGSRTFERDERDLALTVAQQCAEALERASLYNQLEQRVQARTSELQAANDQLADANRQLQDEVVERRGMQRQLDRSREEERARVARELHDALGGSLTALKMDAAHLLKVPALPPEAQQGLSGMAQSIEAAINLVRRLATELRPQTLDDWGLVAALEAHFDDFIKRSGLTGEFKSEVEELALPGDAAIACFRIFQEALTNVARHAQATHVTASLALQDDMAVLRVTDNGRGLRPEDRQAHGHLGLAGMRERASLLAASLEVSSAPGQGTTVLLRLPVGQAGAPE